MWAALLPPRGKPPERKRRRCVVSRRVGASYIVARQEPRQSRRAGPHDGRVQKNHHNIPFGPPIKQEDPLDLSILLSGGKETNQDSLSNGE